MRKIKYIQRRGKKISSHEGELIKYEGEKAVIKAKNGRTMKMDRMFIIDPEGQQGYSPDDIHCPIPGAIYSILDAPDVRQRPLYQVVGILGDSGLFVGEDFYVPNTETIMTGIWMVKRDPGKGTLEEAMNLNKKAWLAIKASKERAAEDGEDFVMVQGIPVRTEKLEELLIYYKKLLVDRGEDL